jgi:hypothetical protein
MLTTRHHVAGPHSAPVSAEIVIACDTGAVLERVKERVVERVAGFLDPLPGAALGGWPFGRDVYASELYEQIESVEGVDYVTELMLSSECLPADRKCAAAPPVWHAEGDLVGLALSAHHLPLVRLDPQRIVVARHTSFVPVKVSLTLSAAATADSAALKRDAKLAIRRFFHPLHDGPAPDAAAPSELLLVDLRNALEAALPAATLGTLGLQAHPARLRMDGEEVAALRIEAGELVNWQASVTVQGA